MYFLLDIQENQKFYSIRAVKEISLQVVIKRIQFAWSK